MWQKGQSGCPTGGKREGAGRKPKALKQYCIEEQISEVKKSFELLVQFRDDEKLGANIRKECATEILDRILGRPASTVKIPEGEKGKYVFMCGVSNAG